MIWTLLKFKLSPPPQKKSPLFSSQLPDRSVGKESTCNAGDPSLIHESGRSAGEGIGYPLQYSWASLGGQLVKNLPTMWETWVSPWVGKIPLRREGLPTSSLENSMDCIVHGVATSQTLLNDFHFTLSLSYERHPLVLQIRFPKFSFI